MNEAVEDDIRMNRVGFRCLDMLRECKCEIQGACGCLQLPPDCEL